MSRSPNTNACGCKRPELHRRESIEPKGLYVRIKVNGKWYWAVKKAKPIQIKGAGETATYTEVNREGERPGGTTKTDTYHLIIGAEIEMPAYMCCWYGELEKGEGNLPAS